MSDDRSQLLNDQEQAMRELLDGRQVGIWTALPGVIKSFDNAAMTVTVQPSIKGVILDKDGQEQIVSLPLLLDVPVLFPAGGNFRITFPLQAGDEVLVVFASRCIDAWWQLGGEQQAMEARMHDLSDGFALLAPFSQPRTKTVSSNAFQIVQGNSTSGIEIGPDGTIRMFPALGKKVQVVGDLDVTGEATIGGKAFSTHTHSGVTVGSGDTGPPV